jgi:hypothetical protein
MEASTTTTTSLITHDTPFHTDSQACISQQDVLKITFTGQGIVLAILILSISIHILQPSLTCILLIVAPIPWIVYNDFTNFINLGPGGTPSTFTGYIKITYLRLFALSDPYSPAVFNEKIYPTIGCYKRATSWLPARNGPRPKIAGIAPQRQIDQPGCPTMYQTLRTSLENLAVRHPDMYRIGTSCFEKKGLALFARDPINATCRGEICHVHDSDKSMHMNLHPDDAKIVLEKGWGERHPLARGGWMAAYVPREFIIVYAPRNKSELDVVCRIIEAAGFWVTGQKGEIKAEKESLLDRCGVRMN